MRIIKTENNRALNLATKLTIRIPFDNLTTELQSDCLVMILINCVFTMLGLTLKGLNVFTLSFIRISFIHKVSRSQSQYK